MKNADDLAKKMGPKLKNDLEAKGFVIDTIIVVSALVSIIVNLVKLSKTCKYTPEQALEHIRRPNLLDKIKIGDKEQPQGPESEDTKRRGR
jgi:hypothetical protein